VGPLLEAILGPQMTLHARSLASDLSDADLEMVSEQAIDKALARIDRFDQARASFATWVTGFVKHEVADFRRSRAKQTDWHEVARILAASNDSLDIPARSARRSKEQMLTELAPQLPPQDVQILQLRLRKLTYPQIAQRLGISGAASRQRHRRAKRRLENLERRPAPGADQAIEE
jgi:RNA polymerase sigma factor (sigma-70 family)